MIRRCSAFILILIYYQLIVNNQIDPSTSQKFDDLSLNYNVTQAELGRTFFSHLIHHNESFKDINEYTTCSLMHFFMQEANINGRHVQFSSGMFVLYDSTGHFFYQFMLAKNAQYHNNDHRSGFIRRLGHFIIDFIKFISQLLLWKRCTTESPFIYLRGDESSHFYERGNKHERYYLYPAYGMDVPFGCMPNGFSHILFGKLSSLSDDTSYSYHGDRIYIKPEGYGLQQFSHYIAHAQHYIRCVSHAYVCQWIHRWKPHFCKSERVFHEWTDRRLIERWIYLLSKISILTRNERNQMQNQALSQGVREIYRQTLLFPLIPQINEFRLELEQQYGHDITARKGDEIIFTTEQLLNSPGCCS